MVSAEEKRVGAAESSAGAEVAQPLVVRRKRGRPRGSNNKRTLLVGAAANRRALRAEAAAAAAAAAPASPKRSPAVAVGEGTSRPVDPEVPALRSPFARCAPSHPPRFPTRPAYAAAEAAPPATTAAAPAGVAENVSRPGSEVGEGSSPPGFSPSPAHTRRVTAAAAAAAEVAGASLPSGGRVHEFLVNLTLDGRNRLPLPRDFVQVFSRYAGELAFIREASPGEAEWAVVVQRGEDGSMFFGGPWKQFLLAHGIDTYSRLLFRHWEWTADFTVRVFFRECWVPRPAAPVG
ncbi:hypothetical protein ACQ4PT_062359 [Festuca glaucescens]